MKYHIRQHSLVWWLKYIGQAVALLTGITIITGAALVMGGVLMRDRHVMETDSICQKFCHLCDKYKTITEIKQCKVRKAREKFIERMAGK